MAGGEGGEVTGVVSQAVRGVKPKGKGEQGIRAKTDVHIKKSVVLKAGLLCYCERRVSIVSTRS